jgi:hypothetical protein
MLVAETIAKIRRAFFIEKKPIKAISRELKLSRRTVRKAIPLGINGVPPCVSANAAAWHLAEAA